MKISLIVAMASNRVIGLNGQMPWHLSADLKKFKQITLGSAVLMGRKTYESIGKPLPGRHNIIISHNGNYQAAGCQVFTDVAAAIASCNGAQELFVIGGATFYEAMLPVADFIYLTEIKKKFAGDTYFPEINWQEWGEIERLDVDNDTSVDFAYSFLKLQKINWHDKD